MPNEIAQYAAPRARLSDICRGLESEGLRMLAVASRVVDASHDHADVRDERDLSFAGFAAFIDPPKESARAALDALAASGVAVKVVSGDSELVCQHLSGLLGIVVGGTLTGSPDIARMDDAALRAAVERTTLFCRVNQQCALRPVANGHSVRSRRRAWIFVSRDHST